MTDLTDEQLKAQMQIARANDDKERRRMKRNLKLLKKTDDLDTAIHGIVDSWLDIPLTDEDNAMTTDDVEDIAQALPSLERILVPGYFGRTTFPFRILRQLIFLHDVNPVDADFMTMFDLSQRELKNNGLKEQLWFLLFFGAEVKEIEDLRAEHKRQQADIRALQSPEYSLDRENSRSSGITPPSGKDVPSLVKRSAIQIDDPQTPGARAQNTQDARSGPTSGGINVGKHHETHPTHNLYTSSYTAQAEMPLNHSRRSYLENVHDRSTHADPLHVQGKKGYAVETYFKEKKFTGAPSQAVENLIRDFHTCAIQQGLDSSQMSLFFINALSDPARQFFLSNCSSDMPFEQITNIMRRHYSSDTRKLKIQSEMDSLDLRSFMHKRQTPDLVTGLSQLVDHISALAPQLPAGFSDGAHKTRYLRRAVMGQDWAQNAISNIATSKYSFIQFITALQESLQLREERQRA